MSTVLLKVPVTEGSDEYIEVVVDRRDIAGIELAAAGDGGGQWSATTLAASLERALPALRTVIDRLGSAATPDEISVELGLAIGGETGLIFTKGTTEATFTVNITWRRSEPPAAANSTAPAAPVE
ncbi:CU044_2847 family protein [Micromonospora sp. CPCC 205558]|uniref:CU044_2847 family protein n=1 Tax=Micromonospora sp. CPCC 205558 TaxID=3122403 RepID=UPI002FF269A4